jgi:hypothetical protein
LTLRFTYFLYKTTVFGLPPLQHRPENGAENSPKSTMRQRRCPAKKVGAEPRNGAPNDGRPGSRREFSIRQQFHNCHLSTLNPLLMILENRAFAASDQGSVGGENY